MAATPVCCVPCNPWMIVRNDLLMANALLGLIWLAQLTDDSTLVIWSLPRDWSCFC